MLVRLLAFGIAKDILDDNVLNIDLEPGTTIAELKNMLVSDFPEFEKLRSLRLAINENYVEDDQIILPNDEVVIIPPVSGG